jgi:histidyl-tRNA synthetase
MEDNVIEPKLASGFRDYLPKDMTPRQKMFDTIRQTFERFGFVPLDTPGIEREEILTGGDPEFKKQIFRTSVGATGESALALRFDLTVPLARAVAAYPNDLPRPFKRYQTGKVWRGERPQAGRFREFVQFDADIVGSKSTMADAEIVSLMYETMTALGFVKFLVRVNNRKVLNGLAAYAGFSEEKNTAVLRAIDKLDKVAWEGVREELLREPGDRNDPGVGLTDAQADAIKRFIDIRGGSPKETLDAVGDLMANSPMAEEGIRELREIMSSVEALGVPADKWTVDLSVARGLGYYTGPVFETILTDLPSIGSVFSGGRYDDLVARFGSVTVPATGASVGVDRLFAAMEKLGIVPVQATVTKVMILNFEEECRGLVEQAASKLRRAGIPTEIYLGQETSLRAQLTNALKQNIPFVVIIGGEEKKAGTAVVKDLRKRKQSVVPFAGIVDALAALV